MKVYIPILEILVSFWVLYFLPEGAIRLIEHFLGKPKGRILKFFEENLRGFLFGSAVTLSFLFAFGLSYEEFVARTVRSTTNSLRALVGMDALSICVRRLEEKHRFTPDHFAEEAARFDMLAPLTYTERQSLLAHGKTLLMTGQASSREDLLGQAYRGVCSGR